MVYLRRESKVYGGGRADLYVEGRPVRVSSIIEQFTGQRTLPSFEPERLSSLRMKVYRDYMNEKDTSQLDRGLAEDREGAPFSGTFLETRD